MKPLHIGESFGWKLQDNILLTPQLIKQSFISIFIGYKVKTCRKQMPITTRSSTQARKYQYKTHNTSRCSTPHSLGTDFTQRKDSRVRTKKENIENVWQSTPGLSLGESKGGLNLGKEAKNKLYLGYTEQQKREAQELKRKNQLLEEQIKKQSQGMDELKRDLQLIKKVIGKDSSVCNKPTEPLQITNRHLHNKFDHQVQEMQSLRSELKGLRENAYLASSNISSISSIHPNERDHENSRRIDYVRNYEKHIEKEVEKTSNCTQCGTAQQQIDEMKAKYSEELRKLQQEVSVLREKEVILEVMQKQIYNKNECIDFLRKELESFEVNSQEMLQVIHTLEQKVEESNGGRSYRAQHVTIPRWKPTNQSFETFRDYV